MASKGQKFKSYDLNFKLKIIEQYKKGLGTIDSMAKEYSIPRKTIYNWLIKDRNKQTINPSFVKNGSGRKKGENIDYKERYEILKKYQAFLKAQRERK